MDGENRRMKQYDHSSRYSSSSRMRRHAIPRAAASSANRRRQSALLSDHEDAVRLPQSPGNSRMSNYAGYGYTGQQAYTGAPFHSGTLQGVELQPYHPNFSRQQQHEAFREHQQGQEQQPLQQQEPPQPQSQQFTPYDPEIVYTTTTTNLNHQDQAQAEAAYEIVPQYQERQSAAIEALSSQFAVPQYFPPSEPTGSDVHAVVSPYLTPQAQSSTAYNSPGAMGHHSAAQPFPSTMAEFTPVAATGRLEQRQQPLPLPLPQPLPQPQPQTQQQPIFESTTVEEAYFQLQHALGETFDRVRAGGLVDASRSLLEISGWLVANAQGLGILRDEQMPHSHRLQLWNNFNICWLAVCQKQKDTTLGILRMGQWPPNITLLSSGMMRDMGMELIQLCDQMEQYGLVDYQMGIWEEEILCVLGQCSDLVDSRPDILLVHPSTYETATAVTTSRS